ncbi:DUF2723 domain-containing protein [Candidatus Gottesmanbacteria bacterium]|nr:DUF2723 domain-containing protein [Candidatus Gottesmanbacteria bacterium]
MKRHRTQSSDTKNIYPSSNSSIPTLPTLTKKSEILILCAVTLFIFSVYRLTASPTIGWVDSGVIAAAAKTLGIPNPPGFPAYLLIAHLFTSIPFGSVVFRLQLLSEFSAIGIALCIFFLVKKYTSFFPALFAMIAAAFSYNIWQQANNVETYTLTNFMLFCLIVWAIKLNTTNKPILPIKTVQILGLGFASGLSMGLNPTIAVLAPAAIIWLFGNRQLVKNHPRTFIGAILLFFLGVILIYWYLPIRASVHPFVNWGDPSTLERLKNHLFGSGLNIYEPATNSINGFTGQPIVFWQSFLHYWHLALFQFTPVLFPLICYGAWILYKKNNASFFLLLSIVLANMAGIILYFGGNQESWMITSWAVFAVFLGIGANEILEKIHTWSPHGTENPQWKMLAARAFLTSAFFPLLFWYPVLDHSKQRFADEYSQILYRNLPMGSIIIGGGDFFNSLTAYTHEVAKERSDIVPITGNMFYIFPWYRENLRKNTNITISKKIDDLIKFKKVEEFTDAIDQLIEDNPTRSVYVTPLLLRDSVVAGTSEGTYKTKKYALIPHGLLLKVDSLQKPTPPDESLFQFPLYEKLPFYLERNYTNALRLLVNDYAVALGQMGEYFLQNKNVQKAYEYFTRSNAAGTKDSVEFLHRLAIFYAQTGQYDTAKATFNSALSKDPENQMIQRNYELFLSQSASMSASLAPPSQASASGRLQKKSSSGLTFSLPPEFDMKESDGKTMLIPKESGEFRIEITKRIRNSSDSVEAFLSKQPLLSGGTLLNQGQAKIPNVDIAFVKVWSMDSTSKLEFFLFQSNVVVHIIVGPSDSPLMRIFDDIVTSMKI